MALWEEQKDKEAGVQVLLIREEWRSMFKAESERTLLAWLQ